MTITRINSDTLAGTKKAFTTRRVPIGHFKTIVSGEVCPKLGDVVLARVDKLGSHKKIELENGRRAQLARLDRIIVAYGNRYAPDQFEAIVGNSLAPCHLVAGGGVAANKVCKHEGMAEPTRITPIGLLADADGQPINLAQYALDAVAQPQKIHTIFVAGTAMNAGKTTTSATLIHALSLAGYKVAGIKGTGTGSGGDTWSMLDMGARLVMDFTDAGLPSTYLAPADAIERGVLNLIGHAGAKGCDVAVVEIADGLQHEETATLLRSAKFRGAGMGIVFAANDALGAQAGAATLKDWGYRVVALSGLLTRSPLAIREASKSTGIDVLTLQDIRAGHLNALLGLRTGADLHPIDIPESALPKIGPGHAAAAAKAPIQKGVAA